MQKKIPQRQCMGCRERKAKRELIRVVRSPEGNVSLDFGGKMNGRGAYRVHGGGFAGTIQAFVPYDLLDAFVAGIDGALGEGACHVLSIRPQGGVEMELGNED